MNSQKSINNRIKRQRKQIKQRNNNLNIRKNRRTQRAPVSIGIANRTSAPQIVATYNTCRIRHRELVTTVTGTAAFTVSQYSINPGIQSTFNWLSQIAVNWERYHINKMFFEYIPRCATTEVGNVTIAPDYDANDSAPLSSTALLNYQNAVDDVPWKQIICHINPPSSDSIPSRYVRIGALATGLDITLYDAGTLNIATENTSTNSLGKLFVEYDITFSIPQSLAPGESNQMGVFYNSTSTGVAIGAHMGTTAVSYGRIGISGTANVFTLTNLVIGGQYIIHYFCYAATWTTAPTMTATSGMTSATNTLTVQGGTVAGVSDLEFIATSTTASFTMAGTTVITTPNQPLMVVTLIPRGIIS